MYQISGFRELVKKAGELDLLFAVWSMPNQDSFTFICQTESKIVAFSEKNFSQKGYVIAPFKGDESIFIIPNILVESTALDFPELGETKYDKTFSENLPVCVSKDEYIFNLNELINSLIQKNIGKVVFSRVEEVKFECINCFDLLSELRINNPDAYIQLFNLPGNNTWISASPEVLLEFNNNIARTIALAATRKTNDEVTLWNKKEYQEHLFVSEYIDQILNDLNLSYNSSEVYTKNLKSGLSHLCRDYSISIKNKNEAFLMLKELHPTPAVCGIPVEDALHLIDRFEQHRRSYYTGFFGPVNYNNQSSLFVNLRTARLTDNSLYLFLGGGITKDSIAEKEFQETELKSETILKALRSQQKIKIFNQ